MRARPTVRVCDSTLRDGSHPRRHAYSVEEVRLVAAGLDRAGVDIVEVSHGDGLGGSSINYGFSVTDEFELIEAAAGSMERARLAVLLLPGIGVKEDLLRAQERGATVARVATHCTEADVAIQHLRFARRAGLSVVGFLMMAHMAEPEHLAAQARIMADHGAHAVYVTDSAGALTPTAARARVAALRAALPEEVEVGFHGHANLGVAIANSLVAVDEGATLVDCCTCGLGAGAGNTPTELFAAVCEREGIATGLDVMALLDVAEEVVRPLLPHGQTVDRGAALLGYCGVYSSFLLHAERAADRFDVPASAILLELGRRGAVGGQEDWIIEVAAELARA